MARIQITKHISIDDREIDESFVRASGPGGQHVNKTSSAVELRFDVRNSPSLPEAIKTRLEALAGSRLTLEGVLILTSDEHRSQFMNRAEVRERLIGLIREATVVPKKRRPTKPSRTAKLKRLEGKSKRSSVKSLRAKPQE